MCLGSIIGDMAGSRFEGANKNPSRVNFELLPLNTYYTDDTTLTISTIDSILNNIPYGENYRKYYRKYSFTGYGRGFKAWGNSDDAGPYMSNGNGSAMRVSPIGFAFDTKEQVLEEAKKSAECTHNSEEGIKGAQAIALSIFMARMGSSKKEIRSVMENDFGYDLLNLKRGFDCTCNGSCPNAIAAFLNSTSFTDTIRKAVLMGGDSDTIACMAGSIAQVYYGTGLNAIPSELVKLTFKKLPNEMADILVIFINKYIDKNFNKPCVMSKKSELYDLYRSIFHSK